MTNNDTTPARIDVLRSSMNSLTPEFTWTEALTIDPSELALVRERPEGLLDSERFGMYVTRTALAMTHEKVERLARRCAKYGLEAPTISSRSNGDGTFDVLVEGLGVKFPGNWRVIAVVDHAVDGMATVAPGAPAGTFERWTNTEPKCDECGRRLARNKTIIVMNDQGDERQVGGKCVTAYLGMTANVAHNLVDEMSDEIIRGDGAGVAAADPQLIASVAVAVTRVLGWRSKAKADEEGGCSTAEHVRNFIFGRAKQDAELREEVLAAYDVTSDQHVAYMKALNEWAAAVTGSDYLDSIRFMLTEATVVRAERIGVIASAPQAFDREIERRLEAERRIDGPVADVPETDERIEITGTIQRIKEVESDYGLQIKMLLATDAGYRLWGTVPSALFGQGGAYLVEAGDRVTFTARVERSRDDATFGFYSRPTKAKIIEG